MMMHPSGLVDAGSELPGGSVRARLAVVAGMRFARDVDRLIYYRGRAALPLARGPQLFNVNGE